MEGRITGVFWPFKNERTKTVKENGRKNRI